MDPEPFRADNGGLTLSGELRRGPDPDRQVILLHGGGQTRHSWSTTAARLHAAGWTTLAYDLRGHGDSGWDPAGRYGMEPMGEDLLAVLGTLGGGPVVLIGASLGGMISMTVTARAPELVRAVVLVDVVVSIEPAGVQRIREFMTAAPDGFATLEEAAGAVHAYNPNRDRPPNPAGLAKNLRQGDDGRWRWHWDPGFISDGDEPQRHADPAALRAAAAQMRVPTLLVVGGHSDVVSARGIEDMRELVPHAEVADVTGAGHMVAGDDNDVFSATLLSFLARV